MAGNYPDPVGHRMAYDADGTIGYYYYESDNVVNQLSSGSLGTLNDEDNDTVNLGNTFVSANLGFIFPELRDLTGYFWSQDFNTLQELSTSANTTNGFDGTWTVRANPWVYGGVAPAYRNPQALSVPGIKAIRFRQVLGSQGASIRYVHLYGTITSGQTPNRLVFWDPSTNVQLAPAALDWGDVPRGSSADRQFRVKNISSTLTAHSVVINLEAPSDTTPSVPGQHTLSTDATSFFSSVNVGDLAPGAISAPVTVRRITPTNASLSAWALRVKATAGSWS